MADNSEQMTPLDKLRANAELVIKQSRQMTDMDFGYNAESVEWLDGFIERQRVRPDMTPELADKLSQVLGSFVGECIIACYGGEWRDDDYGWGVFFDDKNASYPITKVRKQFENGSTDSVYGFFQNIGVIYKRPLLSAQLKKGRWWKRR